MFDFFFFFTMLWSVKSMQSERHYEGNIVYIEYYTELVHNSDENGLLQFLKPYRVTRFVFFGEKYQY